MQVLMDQLLVEGYFSLLEGVESKYWFFLSVLYEILKIFLKEDTLFTTQTDNKTITFMMPCL
jgi:hypothetical protein